MAKFCKSLFLLGALLFLSACGVRFYYNQLDWLLPRYINDYVTFDSTQRLELRERLQAQLDWHCDTELPRYISWLQEIEQSLRRNNLTLADLRDYAETAETFWDALAQSLVPDTAAMLASLDDEQVAELFDDFADKNAELYEKYVEPDMAVRQEQRVERTEKRLRRWFGRLNSEQRDLLHDWSRDLIPVSGAWIENRELWQAELRTVLAVRDQHEQFEDEIRRLLTAASNLRDDDFNMAVAANRDRTLEMFVELYASGSDRQQQRLQNRLQSLANDFTGVACS